MKIGNWPLLLLAIEHVLTHPSQYYQGHYRNGDDGECGSTRCIAGWLVWFAGWRYDRVNGNHVHGWTGQRASIEEAALISLALDEEVYGTDFSDEERSLAAEDFGRNLFGGTLDLTDILTVVRDLAKADGVTPTPLIIDEMLTRGIVTGWDVF